MPRASSGVNTISPGRPFAHRLARLGIDDLDDAEIGIEMKPGRFRVLRVGTFGPRHFRLGETVGHQHVDLARAQLAASAFNLRHMPAGAFSPPRMILTSFGQRSFRGDRFLQDVVDEGRHADQHLGIELAG